MLTIKAFTAESALGFRPPAPQTRTVAPIACRRERT